MSVLLKNEKAPSNELDALIVAALPFLWAYEVSCRARTGSVLHEVTHR